MTDHTIARGRTRGARRGARRGGALLACAALIIAATGTLAPVDAKDTPAPVEHVGFTQWDFGDGNPGGAYDGTVVDNGALTLGTASSTRSYTDPFADQPTARNYDQGSWTSPTVDPAFGLTELVSSWNAHTPGGSWVEVSVQGTTDSGTTSKWYVLGRWSQDDKPFHPTSVPGQGDDLATVSVDTLVTAALPFDRYHLKVSLMRPTGESAAAPTVDMVGAMASAVPETKKLAASPTTMTRKTVLDVPTYSQEVHVGDYPEWDGGGEAWCSPTSTSMVVAYWKKGPSANDMSWIPAGHPDPWVDYTARHTYDYSYDGAGNWPFNTAYAGRYGLESFVTRLRSLAEAEQFIKAGIPVVASVSFKESKLDGAGYGTSGHLLTIVGFAKNGDVVVNDPASHLEPSDDAVRVTYDRAQFENAWIGHTGGISYIIHPEATPLPEAPAEANW